MNKMVGKVGFKPTTFGQCCYRWVFYLNILWFPISSAYIFIIMMFGTLGRIIFIHLLRSTVVECLFAIIQLTSVLTSYSLHRFYRILLGHFTQNRRAIRLHHFPNWNSKNIHFILRNHDQLNSWRMNNTRYWACPSCRIDTNNVSL